MDRRSFETIRLSRPRHHDVYPQGSTPGMKQLCNKRRLHLSHQVAPVELDRDLRNIQIERYLFAERSPDDSLHNLPLTRGESGIACNVGVGFVLSNPLFLIDFDCLAHGVEQCLVANRLGEELDCAGLHCLHRHRYVAISREKND